MKQKLMFFVSLVLLLGMFTCVWADDVIVGTGTSTSYYPFHTNWGYSRSAALYTSSEIGTTGTITNLSWYITTARASNIPVKIYLKTVTSSTLTADTWANLIVDATLVYDTSTAMTPTGWKTFDITDFPYNNDNLLVLCESNYGGGGAGGSVYYRYTTATNMHLYAIADNNPPTANLSLGSSRPNIMISFLSANPPQPADNPVPGNASIDISKVPTLSWQSGGGSPTAYDVYFGTDNPPATKVSELQAGNTYNPGTLTYGQTYYWKIDPYNANGYASSQNVLPVWSFTVMDDPTIAEFPYYQNFDVVTAPALPLGWSVIDNNADGYQWISYTTNPRSAPNCAILYTDFHTTNDDYLVTPPVVLSGNQRLKFWTRCQTTGEPDEISILLSTTTPTAGAFTNVLLPSTPVNFTTYAEYTVNLSAFTGTCYISFTRKNDPADGWRLYVDDVTIENIPTQAVFEISPTEWDFGQVDIIGTAQKQFTITNAGAAPLVLSSIGVTAGADNFSISTPPAMEIAAGASTNFTVLFDPTAIQIYTGTITIEDNIGGKSIHTVDLLGEGYARPAGSTYENPLIVTLPIVDFGDDTSLYGDDYSSTWINPSSNYLDGDDMVLRFTMEQESEINGTLTAVTGSWIGMFIVQTAPNATTPAPVLGAATSSGTSAVMHIDSLPAGTYFLIISTWPTPQSFEFSLNLTATPLAADPIFSIDPASHDYGQVQPDNQVTKMFTITNTGGGTLFIDKDDITITGTDAALFTLGPIAEDISLARNATANITVNFTPLAEGMFSASLQIIDNVAGGKFARGNGAKSTHNIPLTGEGYDSAISTFPFAESFDGSSFPPTGWTNIKTAGTSAGLWERTLVGTYPDCMPHSGEGMAKYNCFSYQPNTEGILVTPPISFSDLNYEVSFWMYRDADYPANLDLVNVYASGTPDLTGSVLLGTINRSLELEPFVDEAGWYQYSFPIPPILIKAQRSLGYIIFEGSSGYGNNIFIDDVLIDVAPEEIVIDENDQTPLPDGVTVVQGGTVPSELLGEDSGLPAQIYTITATGTWDVTVYKPTAWTTDWYCWIMVGNQLFDGPNPIAALTSSYTFQDVNFDAKGAATVVINDNQTLPVELSSFTATVSSDLFVTLKWVSESETDHAGYNVYRAESNELNAALKINAQIINDGAANGTQMSYVYSDFEAYNNMQYYYWLESLSLGGISQFFGPLSVVIGNLAEEPEQPEIQLSTKLLSAFPNPFNPNTNLRYSLKEAGNVAIDVFNLKGQLVRSFNATHDSPGFYQLAWDGRDSHGQLVSSGIYMYRMTSGRYSSTKKMIMAK